MSDLNYSTTGTPLGPDPSKSWRSSQPRVHETATASPRLAKTGLAVTLTKNPYSQGGTVLHLTDAEARDLMTWLIRRYSAIDALGGLV